MGYSIYTDVDSLYDTRIEVVKLINQYEAEKIILDGSYHNRLKERYGNIPYDMFYPIWRRRNKNVFTNALNTMIPVLIQKYHAALFVDEIYSDVKNDIKLYVNIYPYELSIVERQMLEVILSILVPMCKIVTMNVPDCLLSTKWVCDNIGTMFKYNYIEWVNGQMMSGIYDLRLKKVKAVIPGVVPGNMYSAGLVGNDIIGYEEKFKPFLTLEIISAHYFSCIIKNRSNNETEEEKK